MLGMPLDDDDGFDRGPAFDALGVPSELRGWDWDDEDHAVAACARWADPDLPDPRPDPYERPLDADGVRRLLG